jgi:branched-chain amino acid transport system permease protein
VHVLNRIAEAQWPIPVTLLPLVGGVAGGVLAVVLGLVTTRKSGTPFAMITLGLVELVFSMALMVPEFFGGEGGVTANRTAGPSVMGINFGPQIQVYYLLAVYTWCSAWILFAFTQTPLGRLLNAVRDNAERVEFLGFSAQRIRYLGFVVSGFFAGIAGGMYALNFEIATAEVVGPARSGAYLLFTFLGGATVFFGPIIGGILMVLASAVLSGWTKAWLLYLGLTFLIMIIYAPGGLASLVMWAVHPTVRKQLGRLTLGCVALVITAGLALSGMAVLVEMVYHLQLNETLGPQLRMLGFSLRVDRADDWVVAVMWVALGGLLFWVSLRQFERDWRQGAVPSRGPSCERAGLGARRCAQIIWQHRDHPRCDPSN